MRNILCIFLILISNTTFSQVKYDPLSKPNTYQNIDNPNYWKNKMPHKDYWQQDVYYNIKADIDEKTDIITAEEKLTYWNNSPDDLDIVYFHLYQNAFQPGSYCHELHTQNAAKATRWGRYEKQKLGTKINRILVDGKEVKTELDNTILKVYLPQTLKTNQSITFDINFKTYFDAGEIRRRMIVFDSWGNKHYNGVHWYPRICVYDAKFGWTKDQHLGKEFYGNFGCYDVELTFASNFVVGATGFLLNRKEMLPKSLRDKLDVKNFKDKIWNSEPSIIIPYKEGERKTWKFHAENVHDFAFTADPTYRIGEARWKDKVCYSLVQEPHASRWQNAADYGIECVKIFSEDIGMYTYHKMIVADARSGMEYPMVTLDSGEDPGYRGLLVHEIGHNWFFGQVGNNETYRALLDEGFTQFLTAWGLIKIDGEYLVENEPKSKWKKRFKKPRRAIDSRVYYSYINDATKYNDPKISTHSDGFNSAKRHGGGYRHVYYKTATMLYNLQYVLGDELFLDAMKYYFETWKIAHPYDEDFRNSIIRFTKIDLNWFFDQWLETEKRLDYSVKVKGNQVIFKRKSRMQMPIDFRVIAKNGKIFDYHIPNNWFVKETSATILPKWHGWDLIHPEYTTTINVPSGISEVIIDPTNRLADSYMPDNNSKNNITYTFDHKLYEYPDWRNYEIRYRPDIWWNNYDGIKLGLNLNGDYMKHHHRFDITSWFNTGFLQEKDSDQAYDYYSYKLNYNSHLDKISPNIRFNIRSEFIAGLHNNQLSIEKSDNSKNNKLTVHILSLYRTNNKYMTNYILSTGKMNNRIDIDLQHKYKRSYGKGTINLMLQSSAIGSDYDYNKLILELNNANNVNKFKIKTRAFLQLGTGTNWAEESKLYLSGANPEEMMNSKFSRSEGLIASEYLKYGYTTNHFHNAGGLNLRGYTGYLAPEFSNQGFVESFDYNGISGFAVNTEIDFTDYLPKIIRKYDIRSYLFGDAGVITNNNISKDNYKDIFSDIRADAGIGFTYNFNNFRPLENINPIIIRLDIPFFLNRPPASDSDFIQMRWIISLTQAI